MNVNYQGQEIPVYVTLDGKYLIVSPIPLTGDTIDNGNTATGEPVDVEIGDAPMIGDENAQITIVELLNFTIDYF
jgi:hypothetical protein